MTLESSLIQPKVKKPSKLMFRKHFGAEKVKKVVENADQELGKIFELAAEDLMSVD